MVSNKQIVCLQDAFEVSGSGDRVHFDLVIPEDSGRVRAIHLLPQLGPANSAAVAGRHLTQAGWVSLRWAAAGDIFLQAPLNLTTNFEDNYGPGGMTSPAQGLPFDFTAYGSLVYPLELDIPGDFRLICGYYKDSLSATTGTNEAYRVDYFVHYQRRP